MKQGRGKDMKENIVSGQVVCSKFNRIKKVKKIIKVGAEVGEDFVESTR